MRLMDTLIPYYIIYNKSFKNNDIYAKFIDFRCVHTSKMLRVCVYAHVKAVLYKYTYVQYYKCISF